MVAKPANVTGHIFSRYQGRAIKVQNKTAKAFNLIELLIVVAIIIVLASILLPAFSRARDQASSSSCQNHLRQMGIALQGYRTDGTGVYPFYQGYGTAYGGDTGFRITWAGLLRPYMPLDWTNRSYHCPGYKGPIVFRSGSLQYLHVGSYAYNAAGTPNYGPATNSSARLGLGDSNMGVPIFHLYMTDRKSVV